MNADWLFLVSALWFVSCGDGQGVEQGRKWVGQTGEVLFVWKGVVYEGGGSLVPVEDNPDRGSCLRTFLEAALLGAPSSFWGPSCPLPVTPHCQKILCGQRTLLCPVSSYWVGNGQIIPYSRLGIVCKVLCPSSFLPEFLFLARKGLGELCVEIENRTLKE